MIQIFCVLCKAECETVFTYFLFIISEVFLFRLFFLYHKIDPDNSVNRNDENKMILKLENIENTIYEKFLDQEK